MPRAGAPPRAADPNDLPAARRALVALYARRDCSRADAAERLGRLGYSAELIESLLDEFTRTGVINDARYATRLLEHHVRRGQGPARIREVLKNEGLAPSVIDAAFADAPTDWHALALETRRRRFGAEVPAVWAERARQARFLQSRGFSSDHVRSALGLDFDLAADTTDE